MNEGELDESDRWPQVRLPQPVTEVLANEAVWAEPPPDLWRMVREKAMGVDAAGRTDAAFRPVSLSRRQETGAAVARRKDMPGTGGER